MNASSQPPAPKERGRVRFPLRRKLALAALALSVLPLSLLGWVLVDVNADAVETSSRELQISIAQDLTRTIEEELTAAGDGLVGVAAALTDPELDDEARLGVSMALVASNSELDHVAVYAADGTHIDTIRTAELGALTVPPRLDAAWLEAAEPGQVATGAVGEFAGGSRVPMLMPLEAGGALTGYLWSAVDLAPVQARLTFLAETHLAGLPDALFVVDEDLRYLAHVDATHFALRDEAPRAGILDGIDPRSLETRYSRSGEYEVAGNAHVGTLTRMESRPWLIAVQVPRDVAYASMVTMRRVVTGATLVTILAALAAGLWMAGALTKPVEALTRFAAVLAERRFGQTVEVHSGDELETLGGALSRASLDLEASEKEIAQQIAIRSDLGRYLPGEIVERVVAREQDMHLGGERCEITVLFADVVAFTPLTDRLTPEQVVQILNELFTITTEIIFRHGGTVDKFIGDCVMAIWGAPTPQADHARRAVAAAEEILSWLELGNDRWREDFGVNVQLAIGVNSGPAIVGNIGSEVRMEYTAIGDTVNVAARLESIARPQQILITGETAARVGDAFALVPLGSRSLSGREAEIELFEVRA